MGVVLIALIASHALSTVLRSYSVQSRFDHLMIAEASDQYAQQIAAILNDKNVELPAQTQRPLSVVDLIWRANENEFPDTPDAQNIEVEIRDALAGVGAVPEALFAQYAASTQFVDLGPHHNADTRRPHPPKEAWISARIDGIDGWIIAQLRSSPPPPQISPIDIAIEIAVVIFCAGIGFSVIARQIGGALGTLREAAEKVGPSGLEAPLEPNGPSDFHPVFHAFNRMDRRVAELLVEKDVMLGALGHDLRTPLSSLRIRLETMEPVEDRNEAIRAVEKTSDLLEDILELARSGKASPPTTRFDLGSILQDVVLDAQDRGENVSVDVQGTVVAPCKPDAIRRLAQNLISNAVSYAGGGNVRVDCVGEMARIVVEDEGPGLPVEKLQGILEPFQRGQDARTSKTGGSGLGLTLARAVAQAHGGELTLENRDPSGLRVTVTLPAPSNG